MNAMDQHQAAAVGGALDQLGNDLLTLRSKLDEAFAVAANRCFELSCLQGDDDGCEKTLQVARANISQLFNIVFGQLRINLHTVCQQVLSMTDQCSQLPLTHADTIDFQVNRWFFSKRPQFVGAIRRQQTQAPIFLVVSKQDDYVSSLCHDTVHELGCCVLQVPTAAVAVSLLPFIPVQLVIADPLTGGLPASLMKPFSFLEGLLGAKRAKSGGSDQLPSQIAVKSTELGDELQSLLDRLDALHPPPTPHSDPGTSPGPTASWATLNVALGRKRPRETSVCPTEQTHASQVVEYAHELTFRSEGPTNPPRSVELDDEQYVRATERYLFQLGRYSSAEDRKEIFTAVNEIMSAWHQVPDGGVSDEHSPWINTSSLYCPEATHLVVPAIGDANRGRTPKYLCFAAAGKPIVTIDYILASKRNVGRSGKPQFLLGRLEEFNMNLWPSGGAFSSWRVIVVASEKSGEKVSEVLRVGGCQFVEQVTQSNSLSVRLELEAVSHVLVEQKEGMTLPPWFPPVLSTNKFTRERLYSFELLFQVLCTPQGKLLFDDKTGEKNAVAIISSDVHLQFPSEQEKQ